MNLYDLRITGGQDGVRYAAKLLSRFNYLANGISGSDFRPTDQHLEVAKLLQERLKNELTRDWHARWTGTSRRSTTCCDEAIGGTDRDEGAR